MIFTMRSGNRVTLGNLGSALHVRLVASARNRLEHFRNLKRSWTTYTFAWIERRNLGKLDPRNYFPNSGNALWVGKHTRTKPAMDETLKLPISWCLLSTPCNLGLLLFGGKAKQHRHFGGPIPKQKTRPPSVGCIVNPRLLSHNQNPGR